MSDRHTHPLPFGAQVLPDGSARFRLWAPSAAGMTLEVEGTPVPMRAEGGGWFSAQAPAGPGARYRFRMPDGLGVPDPAARVQAGDVHDESALVDPAAYAWRNTDWRGRPWHEAVIYELHVGTLGGFDGVRERLPELKRLGVTAIELMPLADFPGGRNWGYDGVLPYAPNTAYGTPDELKALVDEAHGLGLMVMLDVVYNHFGPDGAYIHAYAREFFREDMHTPWGAAIDFRRPEVREYFVQNALYWLMEYRFDGLRFDAVHAIEPQSFLPELAAAIRGGVEPGRHVHLVLEHEANAASLLCPGPGAGSAGEPGAANTIRACFDAQWADDLHHCLHVLLTGESEGYYADFQDATPLLARCLADGFAYQGEVSPHSGKRRGEPSGHLPTTAFVVCLQNHDQIGNRAMGERLSVLADPQALRAATALLLLSPFVPLLFMGEEWGTRNPFLFFTSHNEELAKLVREGRRGEFKHFSAFRDEAKRALIPDPNAEGTFTASIPDRASPETFDLYRALLAVRRERIMPGLPGCRSAGVDVLGHGAVRARWRLGTGAMLTVLVNLGADPAPAQEAAGEVVFETQPGLAASVQGGMLPGRSALATLGARA